jgi:hypothetical protein
VSISTVRIQMDRSDRQSEDFVFPKNGNWRTRLKSQVPELPPPFHRERLFWPQSNKKATNNTEDSNRCWRLRIWVGKLIGFTATGDSPLTTMIRTSIETPVSFCSLECPPRFHPGPGLVDESPPVTYRYTLIGVLS